MTQQSDFAVPVDDLQPRTYEKLPNGKYLGEVQLGKAGNGKGWEAVEITVSSITAPDGKAEVARRNGDPVRLSGQTRRSRITTVSDNAQAAQIGRQQLTGLAYALGIAQVQTGGDGKQVAVFEFTGTDDALEQLSAGAGVQVGFSIINRERKRKNEAGVKVVQKDDEGNPILDDEIGYFYTAASVAKGA